MATESLPTEPALPVKSGTPTLIDVARLAGTTKGTASRALNGKHWVAPQTRESVMRAARQLGFHADPTAQRLANGGSSSLVGMFVPQLDLGVVTRKLQLLQVALNAEGYEASIHACGNSGLDSGRQAETLANLCRQKPAAIVCYTYGMRDDALRELQSYAASGGTVVCYDTVFELNDSQSDYVVFDRYHNTYQAAHHLTELGHRRIGLFSSVHLHEHNRLRGFKQALREVELIWSDSMSFLGTHFCAPDETPLSEQIGQRLGAHFCTLPPETRPTAMCITDDHVAVAFVAEIMRNGLRVPEDVSVVGHDDMPIGAYASPVPLTTASQPVENIAQETVKLLTSRLSGQYSGPSRRIVVQGELIVRQSAALFEP